MSILIKYVRIYGFRGLENIEVKLNQHTTVLTGMNNTGKTSFLKALQIVFGNTQFISQDDFFVSGDKKSDKIVVDILIVPTNSDNGTDKDEFDEDYEYLFGESRIQYDQDDKQFIPLRAVITFDSEKKSYKPKRLVLPEWPSFQSEDGIFWHQKSYETKTFFNFYEQLPFFYIDAKRDILTDIKYKRSYLGKMISTIEYSDDVINNIENQIQSLNEKVITSSDILSDIKETLKGLNTAIGDTDQGVELTPFTKKVRDINKGMSIYYTDKKDSFSMEYHGIGTRSWSSLLTLKAFVSILNKNAENNTVFFPIIAIEEPESHIHPNAQKKLYKQINEIAGQKIISTHSPYIAASADLKEIRNFYYHTKICCGKINTDKLEDEDIRKIKWKVINTHGEIFFAKAIVFFEGETEEQALPIFAKHYFEKYPFELGINFVGVGGGGNYLPFLRFAEGLNIPWFILSDGEEKIVKKITKDIKTLKNFEIDINKQDNIIILDKGYDFEKYLIENGYIDEIKEAVNQLHNDPNYIENFINKEDGTLKRPQPTKEICKECEQNIYKRDIRNYKGEDGFKTALYDCITSEKTKIAPIIAENIVESKKKLPSQIIKLFERIETSFNNKAE